MNMLSLSNYKKIKHWIKYSRNSYIHTKKDYKLVSMQYGCINECRDESELEIYNHATKLIDYL